MDTELFNRIADLTPYGFYEPCKGMVTVHFFNSESEKPDIMAYLKDDMSWDVREIVSEDSRLVDQEFLGEVITIVHKHLGVYPKDSDFDKLVRSVLQKAGEHTFGKDVVLEDKNKLFRILKNNSYQEN